MTPEINAKVAIWRQRAIDGTLTLEEMKEAILVLRGGRVSAAATSESSRRKKAKVEVPSADDLLNELGEL
jgi:hypothetical protein